MIDILKLADYYREEVLKNILHGNIIDGSDLRPREGLFLFYLDQSTDTITFENNNKFLRVRLVNDISVIEEFNKSQFSNLYWITKVYNDDDRQIDIARLRCPNSKILLAEQNLCISNEYIRKLPANISINRRVDQLRNSLIYSDGLYEYLIIETFPASKNGSEQVVIHGLHSEAKVKIQDDKWVITSSTKPNVKNLSRRFDKFMTYHIQRYKAVNINEESEAKAALNELDIQEQEGKTLLALWEKYSTLERMKKEDLRDSLKAMRFSFLESLPNGRTRIKLNVSESVWASFFQNRFELLGERLEFSTIKGIAIDLDDNNRDDDEPSFNPFIIKKIGKDRVLEISDECYLINKDGFFILSTKGDQTMDDRRQRALLDIREKSNHVLRALRLAIEDRADSIPSLKRESLNPTTERTRAYLKKHFGIEDLTPEQKRAVEMALNSPDIALIQGPPGTGKTTVIAAICDRLEEEAEKQRKEKEDFKKLFLISDFQNDTVEHIASKISTYGIPTPKIGKDTGTIKAEDKFIKQMKNALRKAATVLEPVNEKRISKELVKLLDAIKEGTNVSGVKEKINLILHSYEIPLELRAEWESRNKKESDEEYIIQKSINALESLVTDADSFITEGKKPLIKLSIQKIAFTPEERSMILRLCTAKTVTIDDLLPLKELKQKYISILRPLVGDKNDDIAFLTDWLERLRVYFLEKEETSYADNDTFLAAVIDSITDDLSGNDEHILSSLKEYSLSIAATNQVAGSMKVAEVGNVHNVILEEAARSNPLDLLIPMTRAEDRIILVGDQMQLPHILEPKIADEVVAYLEDDALRAQYRKAYEESLFGRVFKNVQKEGVLPSRCYTLKEQFRMHPTIGNFVSELYYGGELRCYFPDEKQAEMKQHRLSFPLVVLISARRKS